MYVCLPGSLPLYLTFPHPQDGEEALFNGSICKQATILSSVSQECCRTCHPGQFLATGGVEMVPHNIDAPV